VTVTGDGMLISNQRTGVNSMGSGMKFKAKCNICGKKKLIGEGTGEALFGEGFTLKIEPDRLMCADCRMTIAIAASMAANDMRRQLDKDYKQEPKFTDEVIPNNLGCVNGSKCSRTCPSCSLSKKGT